MRKKNTHEKAEAENGKSIQQVSWWKRIEKVLREERFKESARAMDQCWNGPGSPFPPSEKIRFYFQIVEIQQYCNDTVSMFRQFFYLLVLLVLLAVNRRKVKLQSHPYPIFLSLTKNSIWSMYIWGKCRALSNPKSSPKSQETDCKRFG